MSGRKKTQREEDRDAFSTVASFPEGIRVLQMVYQMSGYGSPGLTRVDKDGKADADGSLYNFSKRDLWCALRQYIHPNDLLKIEKEKYHDE